MEERDPKPPADVPLVRWGEALPMRWGVSADGSVHVSPRPHFLTKHGASFVIWSSQDAPYAKAFGAFHVNYPDGERGEVRCQRSTMGMVVLHRPWRRRRGDSWWPGDLEIRRHDVRWSDHANLQELWQPSERELRLMQQAEFDGRSIPSGQFHWPYLYLAMCEHDGFLTAVRSDDFASSVFVMLRDSAVVRKSDGASVTVGSDRRYGDMLGAWRRCGESYLDFLFELPGTPEKKHEPEIERMFDEAGFVLRKR